MRTRTVLLILFLGPLWRGEFGKDPEKRARSSSQMMTALLTLPGQSGIEIRRLYASVDASLAERKYDRPLADLNRASDLAPEFALPNGSSACSNVSLCLAFGTPTWVGSTAVHNLLVQCVAEKSSEDAVPHGIRRLGCSAGSLQRYGRAQRVVDYCPKMYVAPGP
jgi:hypothetical protein